jgi:uncharacterized RmlC-like cupin family protein
MWSFILTRVQNEFPAKCPMCCRSRSGDFFHVPAGTVHREIPSEEKGEVIIAFVGTGPLAVNVEDP